MEEKKKYDLEERTLNFFEKGNPIFKSINKRLCKC